MRRYRRWSWIVWCLCAALLPVLPTLSVAAQPPATSGAIARPTLPKPPSSPPAPSVPRRAVLTTFTVGTLTDDAGTNTVNCTNAANTDCSLRSALTAANGNGGGDTIVFRSGLSGEIILTNGQLTVSVPVTITGPTGGTAITLNGNNATRIMQVGAVNPVRISNLTFRRGYLPSDNSVGAAIANNGTLALANCTFTDNNIGGVSNSGGAAIFNNGDTLTVTDSTFSANTIDGNFNNGAGGAIASQNSTSFVITRSAFVGNTGSAISLISGSLSITDSTFLDNTDAESVGGALAGNPGTNIAVTNSTFVGNSARDSGGAVYAGSLTVQNSTFTGNRASGGGAITSNATLTNTIVANSGGGGLLVGSFSGTNNLIDDAGSAGGFANGVNGNIVGRPALLGLLGSYSGPTQTVPLLPGSPAINAGTTTGASVNDQRGVGRNGNVDIGAFESRGFALTAAAGNNQTATVGTAFANALAAAVTSAFAEPVAGGVVAFTAPGSGASATLSGTTATIGDNARASVSAAANPVAGAYAITASVAGASATFNLTNRPDVATTLALGSIPATTAAGAAQTVSVTAKDRFGNTATGYTGTVHFTSSDAAATLPANYSFVAGDNGVKTFSVTFRTTGQQSLFATDTANGAISGGATTSVTPAMAAALVVTGAPASVVAGTPFSVTVTARDGSGNIVTGYTGTVHFASSDGQAALPADSTLMQGSKTFSVTLKTAGNQTLAVTDSANSLSAPTQNVAVAAADVSQFALSGNASTQAGADYRLTVTAKDAYGNTVTGYRGTVGLSSSDPLARLPGSHVYSAANNGAFTFTLTLSSAGSRTVTATDVTNGGIAGSMTVSVTGPVVVSTGPSTVGVTPISGPQAGGTTITIQGANLQGASVTVGGLACQNISVNGAGTALTCVTPAHAAGTVDVVITTADGSFTAQGAFTYLPSGGVPPVPGGRPPSGGSGGSGGGPVVPIPVSR